MLFITSEEATTPAVSDLGIIKNSVPVTLGSNILKSETAGVVASSLVMNSIYND